MAVLLLMLLCAAETLAGSIAGRVTGRGEAEALVGVNVLLQGTQRGTTTNERGEYRLTDVPAGTYTLVFSLVGYKRETRQGLVVRDDQETMLNVVMTQAPVQAGQVIVTASKREQSLAEVPVSVSVLDAADIQQRNTVSLDEALRYVPGVNLTGGQVNIRGSSGYSLGAGSRVLMLLDGIPFMAGDTGELNFESIPMGQVDRIEVVKGASSALYGSNALGGVINIITKAIPETPETYIRGYGGFYSAFPAAQWHWSDKTRFFNGQSISHARRVGDLGMSFFFSHQADDGYRQNDYRRRYNFFLKTREEISPTSSLVLDFGLVYQYSGQFLYWRSLDSALIPPVKHETDNLLSTRYYWSGSYNNAVTDRFLITAKTLWYHNTWGFQQTNEDKRTESLSDDFRLELMSTLVLNDVHTLTFGVDGDLDLIGGDMFQGRTIGGGAAYAQDEAKVLNDLTLTIGGRFDFQSIGLAGEKGQVNPKVAVAYNPLAGTTVRASFGQGFRVPSLPEAFVSAGSTGLVAVPNRGLKPEKSWSYELGVAQTLGDLGSFDVAAFRTDFSNMIEPGLYVVGDELQVQWRNVTKARVEGVEASLKNNYWDGGLSTNIGYTYVYPQDITQHDILKYRPRHVLYANARAQWGWLNAGVDFRYVSKVERIDESLVDTGVIPDGDARVPIYVTDFRLGVDLSSTGIPLTATLNVNNAFQHRYVELIGNVMPPRHYVLVLDAKL